MTKVVEIIEVWKPVFGFEGFYMISNLGRAKSLDKPVNGWNGTKVKKGKILKPHMNERGYIQYAFSHQQKTKYVLAHSLVLTTFVCERPLGNVAMHLNDIKTDNRLINLSWGTQSENVKDSYVKGNACTVNKRKVLASNMLTGKQHTFESVSKAKSILGTKNISKVLSGERPHCKNYTFKYL